VVEQDVQRFYEKEAEMYDESRFKSVQGIYVNSVQKETVLKLVGDCRGKHVLEIGSGTGRFTKELVKRGAHVVCIDLSSKMHEKARQSLNTENVEYFVMNGSHLGFAEKSFDICIAINVMSHIKNSTKVFTEVNRILRKEGIFIVNFPNMSGIYFPLGVIVNLFERSLQAPVYSRWYTLGFLINSLRGSGLEPVQHVGRIIFPKNYCPIILFNFLKKLDRIISDSTFNSVTGNLFIKSHKF